MGSRVVQPETIRIPISQGDWLLVKKYLTAGERRRSLARMVKTMSPGSKTELDPEQVGLSETVEYLVDWSFPESIRNEPSDVMAAILLSFDPESFGEILAAIQAHEQRMQAEKNARGDERKSSATSASPDVYAGATNG